jgi:8-oxo-dGTP pyrophosphatase MutT (NUDIX family)
MEDKLFDVFQPGLIRGAASMPHAPQKKYFYVEHPTEGWRVFLRAVCFLHEEGNPDPKRFLVVKRFGAEADAKSWEPPKGQMEGKDGLAHPRWPILRLITENMRREVDEEAKVRKYKNLQYTGLVLQSAEPDYPENTYFQYHCFRADVEPAEIQRALEEFEWLNAHPKYFARVRKDKREKDALAWFDPRRTRMMGKWSPSILVMYLKAFAS